MQSVQYTLDSFHLSSGRLDVEFIGGTAYIRGQLARLDGREITSAEVEDLELALRSIDGIEDVVFELDRWERNQGRWELRPEVKMDQDDLETFVKASFPTLFKLQILLFFNKNPGTADNVGGIAMRLGSGPAHTHKALEELTEAGWLRKVGATVTAYQYDPDPRKREMMRQIQEMHDRSPGGRARLFKMITRTGAPTE